MVTKSKVPMLKPGEYKIWRMRIEQYIQMIDYALWEVIENGATLPKITSVEGVVTNTKKQKVEDDKETVELKQCLEISPDEKEVTIDAIPLAIKSPNCSAEVNAASENMFEVTTASEYQVNAANQDYAHMVAASKVPMLKPENAKKQKVEDDKETAELKQCLEISTDEKEIYMLVEKKYPFAPLTHLMMLEKKLIIDYESEMAYQLLKFIIKQLKKGGLLGLKVFLMLFGLLLLMFVVSSAQGIRSIEVGSTGNTVDFDEIQRQDAQAFENTSQHQPEVEHNDVDLQTDVNLIRRSARAPQAPEQYGFYVDAEEHELGDHGEPPNYRSALLDPEFKKWLEAINEEMQSMKDNQV
ncbi:hypothetical protein Tco_1091173 [Tanacetum coccineum]|uniref:Uncharacterized protein n=1 Tax=Tanacetum coccineum TaxID=301880 RepID=A0ABQ5I7M5_9ASTR